MGWTDITLCKVFELPCHLEETLMNKILRKKRHTYQLKCLYIVDVGRRTKILLGQIAWKTIWILMICIKQFEQQCQYRYLKPSNSPLFCPWRLQLIYWWPRSWQNERISRKELTYGCSFCLQWYQHVHLWSNLCDI
jgi:hypothetical protein